MKNTKSLIIGILSTALIIVTVGAVGKPSSEAGRYQQWRESPIRGLIDVDPAKDDIKNWRNNNLHSIRTCHPNA